MGAQFADVPMLAAEQPQRRHPVVGRTRPIVEGEHANQRRLASAVRTENRRVLALVDRKRQPIKHAGPAAEQRRVHQLQNRDHRAIFPRSLAAYILLSCTPI
jgi:hypothetical protein